MSNLVDGATPFVIFYRCTREVIRYIKGEFWMNLISVIVPVYNVEKYINKCVDSIINQTYKDLEIILVNDGSLDNGAKICDDYAVEDSRIKVIHKKNGGLSDARNVGIDVATGIYIMFVDSDDYIEINMVELMHSRILTDKSDMVLCNFKFVNENGESDVKKNMSSPIRNEILTKEQAQGKLCADNYYYYVVAWNKLYKKKLFDEIRFPYGKIHEDEFIVHLIINKCETISYMDDFLYNYLQRSDSIMHENYSVKNLDAAEAFILRTKLYYSTGYYKLASHSLLFSVYVMNDGYNKLDNTKKINCDKFSYLKENYNNIYKLLILKKIGIKSKIILTIYYINPCLLNKFIKIVKRGMKK